MGKVFTETISYCEMSWTHSSCSVSHPWPFQPGEKTTVPYFPSLLHLLGFFSSNGTHTGWHGHSHLLVLSFLRTPQKTSSQCHSILFSFVLFAIEWVTFAQETAVSAPWATKSKRHACWAVELVTLWKKVHQRQWSSIYSMALWRYHISILASDLNKVTFLPKPNQLFQNVKFETLQDFVSWGWYNIFVGSDTLIFILSHELQKCSLPKKYSGDIQSIH